MLLLAYVPAREAEEDTIPDLVFYGTYKQLVSYVRLRLNQYVVCCCMFSVSLLPAFYLSGFI